MLWKNSNHGVNNNNTVGITKSKCSKQQESIPVGRQPPAYWLYVLHYGRVWTCRGLGVLCIVRSKFERVGKGQGMRFCKFETPWTWTEWQNTTENFTLSQLRWWALKIYYFLWEPDYLSIWDLHASSGSRCKKNKTLYRLPWAIYASKSQVNL